MKKDYSKTNNRSTCLLNPISIRVLTKKAANDNSPLLCVNYGKTLSMRVEVFVLSVLPRVGAGTS